MTGRTLRFVLALGLGLFGASSAKAQTYTFTQPLTGTTGNFSTASNWSPSVPTSTVTTALVFNTFGGNANSYTLTNDISAFTENSFAFNNYGTGSFTITSTTAFTMGGASPFLALNGAASATIGGTGTFVLSPASGTTTLSGDGNGSLTISRIISGSGGLTINQTNNGIFNLTGANTFTGGVTLTAGTLQVGTSALAFGDAANVVTINGGQVRFGSALTYANAFTLNADLVIAGGTGSITGASGPTLSGVISGAGGIRIISAGGTTTTHTLTNANTFNGAVVLDSLVPALTTGTSYPTIALTGANGSILNASSITLGRNTSLTVGGTTANANRLGNSTPILLRNGRFNYVPVTAGTNEVTGALTLEGLPRFATTATGVSDITFASLTRNANAGLWFESSTFGIIQAATPATRVFFTAGLTGANAPLAIGSGTGTEIAILPYAAGSSSTNPLNLVTYDATNGIQVIPQTNSTYFVQIASAAAFTTALSGGTMTNKNIHLTGSGTFNLNGGILTVNSIATDTSTVTFTNGTLKVFSGAIVNFDHVAYGTGLTLDFGVNTGYINSSYSHTFLTGSTIIGSGGLVVQGNVGLSGGTGVNISSFQNPGGNSFTGGLFVNGNTTLGFRLDNQLGAGGGAITLSGGRLAYNEVANLTINRPFTINDSGGFSFNATSSSNATAGVATASTVLEISGAIGGAGTLTKEGVGILNLTGANNYAGGTMISAGTVQFTTDGNLGLAGSRILLNGGTLQALGNVTTSARQIQVNASSTITTGASLTANYAGALNNIGNLYGTALPTVTIAGAGTTVFTGASPLFTGAVAVSAGSTFQVSGGGTLPKVSTVTVPATGAFQINDTTYTANRFGPQSSISVGGGLVNYTAGTTPTGSTDQRFGNLIVTATGGVLNIDGTVATSDTNLRFGNLVLTSGNITLRGTNLGSASSPATHIFFDGFTTNQSIIPNVFFASTSGTGTTTTSAGYDTVLGIIMFQPTPVSGNYIDNIATTATPAAANALPVSQSAAFTVNQLYNGGNARAVTGAVIYSLTLAGFSLDLFGGNASQSGNGNTADGTLLLSGGLLTASTASVSINSAAARTLSFGSAVASVTTTTNLTTDANVTIAGTGGLTKSGAGVLTVNGPVTLTGGIAASGGTTSLNGIVASGNAVTLSSASTLNVALSSTFGATTLTGGSTLNLTLGGTLGASSFDASTITSGATLTLGGVTSSTTASVLTVGANNLTITQATTGSFLGTLNISGAAVFTKAGTATLTLTPVNAPVYTGGTVIANGTLLLGNANAASAVFGGPLTFGAGTTSGTLDLNGFSPPADVTSITIVGTGTGHQIVNSNSTTASTVNLNLPANATIPIAFGGFLNVNKNDATTLILTGTSISTPALAGGVFRINAGTLQLNAGSQGLVIGMSVSVANLATFRLNGASTSNSANPFVTVTVDGGGSFLNSGTSYFDTYVGAYTLGGGAGGGATVSSTAAGIGSYYHITPVLVGQIPTITSLASTATNNFTSTNASDQIQNDGAVPLVVNVAQGTTPTGVDLNIAIPIRSGTTATVTKTGNGSLALSGLANASTYAFNVNAGKLLAQGTGTGTGAIAVNSSGTYGGTGTSTGVTTVNSGGFIQGGSPASPVGTLTSTANVTLTNNGGIRTVVNGSTQASLINLLTTNVLNLNPGAGNTFAIDVTTDPSNAYNPNTQYTVTLVTVGTAGNIQVNGVPTTASQTISPSLYTLTGANLSQPYSLVTDAGNTSLVLTFTPAAVPEPGSMLAIGGVVMGGLGWYRRRKARKTA